MEKEFIKLTGTFIHHCGALEFLINNTIRALSTDEILSSEVISSQFYKRINLLRFLLKQRTDIDSDVIDSLCDELDEIRIKRNIVAHNPILSTKPDNTGEMQILVIRHKPSEVVIPEKLTKDDISGLVNKTNNLVLKLTELIPESKET